MLIRVHLITKEGITKYLFKKEAFKRYGILIHLIDFEINFWLVRIVLFTVFVMAVVDWNLELMLELIARNILETLLTKDKAWEYENEWRVLLPNAENPIIKIPITGVYLGAYIAQDCKGKNIEIAKKQDIPVRQIKMDRVECRLYIESVS